MRRRSSPGSGTRRRGGVLVLALLLWPLLAATPAAAHPLGDFTVNTHIGVRVEPAAVALAVVVDVAEVPTLRAFPDAATETPGEDVPEADRQAYRDRLCPALREAVEVRLDGVPVQLASVSSSLDFLSGNAGLATARLECGLRSTGDLDTVGRELVLTDRMAVQPIGWREVTAVGDGVRLAASDVPERSTSDVLRAYRADLLDEPLDQRGATLRVVAGSGVVTGAPAGGDGPATGPSRGLDPLTTAFTDLVSTTRLSLGFGVVAVALAVLLGSLHAFAPGHGKTLMAAYLVGREGSLRQAAVIGVSVTLTHTAGVLVLGVLLSVALVTAPQQVYPWLGLASGLLLVGIGIGLLRAAWQRRHGHGHSHAHGHSHGHGHGHSHFHGHRGGVGAAVRGATRTAETTRGAVAAVPGTRARNGGLLAMGFAGGLVPSPSALVVLLGGIALGRAWFGVLLVLAYGVGMALALVGTGLLLVRARGWVERWSTVRSLTGRRTGGALAAVRALPLLTAGLVVAIGAGLTVRAVAGL